MKIKPISLGLAEKLQSKRFRERFLATLAKDEIAAQIRELRIKRGFETQNAFAKETGMQQSAVSRIEQADYSGWTFRTLLKVAFALGARLRVTFEPIEDVLETARRSEQSASVQVATVSDESFCGGEDVVNDDETLGGEVLTDFMPVNWFKESIDGWEGRT